MTINSKFNGFLVAKKEIPSKKDTSKFYYNLVIECDDEADTLSCTKEVFDSVDKHKNYTFEGSYMSTFKFFNVVKAEPVK